MSNQKKQKPRDPHCCSKSYNHFIKSLANIENSLAEAIRAQSEILKSPKLSKEDYRYFSNKLEETIKLAIKKEIILEFLIEDIRKGCKNCHKQDDQICPPEKCCCCSSTKPRPPNTECDKKKKHEKCSCNYCCCNKECECHKTFCDDYYYCFWEDEVDPYSYWKYYNL